ncbi:MAG: Fic family protein [Burkholderiaceae bacterium]|jgi:Fic family protein|nr:Fic family protein [Burkholderiaceae bacterium]
MRWNWQQEDWPHFAYDKTALAPLEERFLRASGEFIGIFRHVDTKDQDALRIELISEEALKTSEIEGEILDRVSVQSSLRQQFGLDVKGSGRVRQQERGIAEMMSQLFTTFAEPLQQETLFSWHNMLMSGTQQLRQIGHYRDHSDPMQIVSGPVTRPKIHFEAPPSKRVPGEMARFIQWFNDTAPHGPGPLPALTRAGIAHLYFESIHPFEDGNGRIGRALVEKVLSQHLGQPYLLALSYTIERGRKAYYDHLERANKHNEITSWLLYFAETILAAQQNTVERVTFVIEKARFYNNMAGRLNERQAKVIARLFREGPEGFKGGLSANNYISITRTSPATATRDLQDLVDKGALIRTGERRYTRYWLNTGKRLNPS